MPSSFYFCLNYVMVSGPLAYSFPRRVIRSSVFREGKKDIILFFWPIVRYKKCTNWETWELFGLEFEVRSSRFNENNNSLVDYNIFVFSYFHLGLPHSIGRELSRLPMSV